MALISTKEDISKIEKALENLARKDTDPYLERSGLMHKYEPDLEEGSYFESAPF